MIDKQFYKENGYLVVKNLFYKAETQRLLDLIRDVFFHQVDRLNITNEKGELYTKDEALFQLFKKDKTAYFNCLKICQWLPELHRLGVDKTLFFYLTQLGLSKPTISTRPIVFMHSKHITTEEIYFKTPAHRDFNSIQGSNNGAVVWSPLLSITNELGPLEIIPGSHLKPTNFGGWKKSFGLEAETQDSEFYKIYLEAGDVIIFHVNLVHRSGLNSTDDRIRYALNFRYSDLYHKSWIERAYYSPYSYSAPKSQDLYVPNLKEIF